VREAVFAVGALLVVRLSAGLDGRLGHVGQQCRVGHLPHSGVSFLLRDVVEDQETGCQNWQHWKPGCQG